METHRIRLDLTINDSCQHPAESIAQLLHWVTDLRSVTLRCATIERIDEAATNAHPFVISDDNNHCATCRHPFTDRNHTDVGEPTCPTCGFFISVCTCARKLL
jgi:hypothetical protein